MAEISYPFAAASPGGGSEMVSQNEWQNMATLWASDRIDFQFQENSYAPTELPFYAAITGPDLVIQPGSAWVGGFYYRSDAPISKPAPANAGAQPRIDLVVLRADLGEGSVNLAIKTGTPAANPQEPAVQRVYGGVWEMPLWAIRLEANNGARTVVDRRRFDGPGHVWTPQFGADVSASIPPGNFIVNMDAYKAGYQYEGFRGRDGFSITRHLGKRWSYTPDLFTVTNKPATSNRKGYWRYIAPGTVFVAINIENTSTKAVTASGDGWTIGFTLPIPTSKTTPTILSGFCNNPERRNNLPNFIDITCKTGSGGNTSCYLYYPNPTSPKEGLDGFKTIPGKSTLTIMGVYETNQFD